MEQLNTDNKQSTNSIVYTETDNTWLLVTVVRKQKLGY